MPPIEPSNTPARTSAPPGREREHRRAGELLAAARNGQGGLLLIAGEAGIGKTTLLRALAGSAQMAGVRVAVGRCDDLDATPPHGPWLDAQAPARDV